MSASRGKIMRVAKGAFVSLDYALYADDGDLIEATDDEDGAPVRFVHGYGTMLPAVEQGILGMAPGETREIVVPPEAAYGAHDPERERWVDRAEFPAEIEIDDEFAAEGEDGEEITLRVVEITDEAILVDENHPLAGDTLRFDVVVREVRPPTDEETAEARAKAPKTRLSLAPEGAVSAPPPPPRAPVRARDPLDDDEQ